MFVTLPFRPPRTEAVIGIEATTLARLPRLGAARVGAPCTQAGFGDVELYSGFAVKATVLAVQIAKNHPLPDGNKRLAWQALTMFCALNGYTLEVSPSEAVDLMLGIAAGDLDEGDVVGGRALPVATWLERTSSEGRSTSRQHPRSDPWSR